MELEPQSAILANGTGVSTPWGAVSTRDNSVFFPGLSYFLDTWNDPWTGDETLSSQGGAGSIIYEPQLIRDRPVGGTGDFHTLRGGINSGDRSVFVPGLLSELYSRRPHM